MNYHKIGIIFLSLINASVQLPQTSQNLYALKSTWLGLVENSWKLSMCYVVLKGLTHHPASCSYKVDILLESLVRQVVEGNTTIFFNYIFCVDLPYLVRVTFRSFKAWKKYGLFSWNIKTKNYLEKKYFQNGIKSWTYVIKSWEIKKISKPKYTNKRKEHD